MNKLVFYPAVFHKAEEGGFWISFPDLPECFTEGDDMIQAYEMAVNALGLALTSREAEKQTLPEKSRLRNVPLGHSFWEFRKSVLIWRNLCAMISPAEEGLEGIRDE